jgi:RNA polymerase sigma-70 factor (ECF subfamily)
LNSSAALEDWSRSLRHPAERLTDRAEEQRLVRAARDGDRRALDALARRLSGPLYRFGRGFCRDPHDAEDVVQDVLVALARSLDRFRGEGSLSSWAYVVARNACARRRRHSVRTRPLESADGRSALERPDPAGPADRALERRELREALVEAIGALPTAQRDVLVLRDVESLPGSEVARRLGLDERAMKSRLHRARLALRARLAAHARPGAPAPGPECPDTARLLSRYLERELDANVCERLASHVATCGGCAAVCETLRIALDACRDWGNAPVPAAAQAGIRAALKQTIAGLRAAR